MPTTHTPKLRPRFVAKYTNKYLKSKLSKLNAWYEGRDGELKLQRDQMGYKVWLIRNGGEKLLNTCMTAKECNFFIEGMEAGLYALKPLEEID